MRNKKKCQTYLSELTQNCVQLTNNKVLVNEFNNFFTNIGEKIANKFPNVSSKTTNDYLRNKNDHSMFLVPTDEEEIHSEVSVFRNDVN